MDIKIKVTYEGLNCCGLLNNLILLDKVLFEYELLNLFSVYN